MSTGNLTLTILILLFDFQLIDLKEWRGIIPLHSTKADVERLLGTSTSPCDCSYSLEDVTVHFVYSLGECENGWRVPKDTVVRISVSLKNNRPKFSEMNIDLSQYEKIEDKELPGILYYKNETAGHMLVVKHGGEVTGIDYIPSTKYKHLRCQR